MDMLTAGERDFLQRVRDKDGLRLVDRAEDKIRQKMRRKGYAKVEMNPRRWVITPAGSAALGDQP